MRTTARLGPCALCGLFLSLGAVSGYTVSARTRSAQSASRRCLEVFAQEQQPPSPLDRASGVTAAFRSFGGAAGKFAQSVASSQPVQDALSSIERAAQEAAGQTEEEIAAQLQRRTDPLAGRPEPLPDSFDDSVALSVQACAEALIDGRNKMVIEFDTSAGDETYPLLSRTLTLVQPFLGSFTTLPEVASPPEEGGGPRLQLLFPDEGTAAFVKQKWDLPPDTICTSMGRERLAEGTTALLLVAPGATEVAAVQRLLNEVEATAPTLPVLMFNPKLVDMQSTGYGLVGRELRNQIASTFETVLCLKTLFGGALFRMYPGDFTVWREEPEAEGGYVASYAGFSRPAGDDLDDLLTPPAAEGEAASGGDLLGGLGKFIKGFQAM